MSWLIQAGFCHCVHVRVCVRGCVLMHASGVQYLLLSYAGTEWGGDAYILFGFFFKSLCVVEVCTVEAWDCALPVFAHVFENVLLC